MTYDPRVAQISGATGSSNVGDTNTYTNFTPTSATVKGALSGIDSALVTGSFANADLSNLTSPTAINQTLQPVTDNAFNLGTSSFNWTQIHGYSFWLTGHLFANLGTGLKVQLLGGGIVSANLNDRTLIASDGTTIMVDWSTPGIVSLNSNLISDLSDPSNPQDAATKNYVDSQGFLTSAANTSLSNLSSVAINTDLIFNTGTSTQIYTAAVALVSQSLMVKSGDSTASGGTTGNVTLQSGESDQGSGNVLIKTGTGVNSTGSVTIKTEDTFGFLTHTGGITLSTGGGGANANSTSGDITLQTSNNLGNPALHQGSVVVNARRMDMSSTQIINLADPTSAQGAATKFYVDNAIAGLSWKAPARAASVANVSVSSAPASIDGVTLVSGDRVLLKDQTAPAQNGIYIFNGTGSALTRSTDADSWNELVASVLLVLEGTVNTGSKWVNTNIFGGTIGTTAVTFVAFSVAGTVNGTGTTNYVAYWSGTSTLTAEQFLSISRGGTGTGTTSQNFVFAGPTSGSGSPSFRALVSGDIPNNAANTTGTASNITASSNSTLTTLTALTTASSLSSIGTITTGVWNGTTIAIANGGTGATSKASAFDALSPMTTGGDLIYGGASGTGTRLANGTSGQVLTSSGGTSAPTWSNVPGFNTGDISTTSFSGANNQTSAADVTGLAFANGVVRSFYAKVNVLVNATSSLYQTFTITGIQRAADWIISYTSAGDNSLVVFSITTAGQVQYTSGNYAGFVSLTFKFKADVIGV